MKSADLPFDPDASRRRGRARFALLAAILFIYFFAGVAAFPFTEPDEGRYGSIGAEMARTGDWITPRLNGLYYFEKPPLFFWCEAVCFKVFGYTEWAARLTSAAAAFATALLLYQFGRRIKNAETGILAAAVFAATPLVAIISRVALVDPLLTLFTTAALYGFWRAFVDPARTVGKQYIYYFWAACALATLVKGPIGMILPLSACGGYLLATRRFADILKLCNPIGIILFFAIAAPWYAAMESKHPGYFVEFIERQYLGRFFHPEDFGRGRPIWYYVPVFVGTLLPWTAYAPIAALRLRRDIREGRAENIPTILLLACGVVVPLVVLSLSGGKLAYYILPLCPPFALCIALAVERDLTREPPEKSNFCVFAIACGGALMAASTVGISYIFFISQTATATAGAWTRIDDSEHLKQIVMETVSLVLRVAGSSGFILILFGIAMRRRPRRALHGLVAPAAIGIVFITIPFFATSAADAYSAGSLCEFVDRAAAPGDPVICYTEFVRTMPWKLGHPVVLFNAPFSEFGHAFTDAETAGISLNGDIEKLKALLVKSPGAVVIDNHPPDGAKSIVHISPVPVVKLATIGAYTVWKIKK
ncbi:MAG: glycosyltransferase family 39 protein [Planctomycetes bacterium]|nr:glycosyltransferase family 39 protein [Planctomycetota bacterium]